MGVCMMVCVCVCEWCGIVDVCVVCGVCVHACVWYVCVWYVCVWYVCVEGERERVTIMRPIPHDSSAHSCYRTPAELQCRS